MSPHYFVKLEMLIP